MSKYVEKITCMEDVDRIENHLWNEGCRFNIHEFCKSGGFTADALQEYFDLAREGYNNAKE